MTNDEVFKRKSDYHAISNTKYKGKNTNVNSTILMMLFFYFKTNIILFKLNFKPTDTLLSQPDFTFVE
ncbi:hypothetical protein BN1195_01301 [Chryseobacterium oranimense G311]|nr:hypothetical protein BN1195_01301 [Chryseobacterium oranimense G311]